MAEPLEIVITAKDEASRVLDQVRTRFSGFDQDIQRTGGRMFDGLGGSVERLAVSFTRTLDPALGASVSRFSTLGANIARTAGLAGGFATVLGGTVVAAAAVAGLGLNQYIGTLSRVSQEQAKTNALLDAMDFGGLAGRAQGLTRQMGELQATFSSWQVVKNITVGALNEIGGAIDRVLGSSASGIVRRFGSDKAALDLAREARAQAGAALTQLVPGEIAKVETRSRILGFQTGGELAGLGAQEAIARRDVTAFLAEMDRREQALSNELSARERLIVQEGEARMAAAPPEARPALEAEIRAQREALGRTAAFDQLRRQRSVGAEQIGLGLAAGQEDLSRIPEIRGTEADAALAERQRAAELDQVDLLRERADILGQLTPELEAQLVLHERDLLLSRDNLTEQEKALINARAEIALLEQMMALDPVAGLTRGFSDAANRARHWGTELEQVARETDRTMSRTFSDGLFNLFTGRKGEDLGKQFAEGLLRSLTDLVGRQLSGTVSGFFANALRAFVPGTAAVSGGGGGFDLLSLLGVGGGGGGAIISPTGAPAGTLVMTQAGLVQVTPSGALQFVEGGGGGGGFGIDPTTGIGALKTLNSAAAGFSALGSNFAIGGLQGALFGLQGATVGGATVVGPGATAGFLAAEVGATGTGTVVGASGGTSGLLGSGGQVAAGFSGAAGAASGVLAGIALGFTIYSGLSQEQTALNIAINTISGAVSGAVLGAVIGTIISPGAGTIIGGALGAIIGGAAAGGTTGLKAPKKMSTSEKSLRIAEAASNSLVNAIRAASSIEDLVAIFNTQWAPGVNILTTYQGVTYWAGDYDDPAGPAATVELMIIPEFLDALEIQVGEAGAPRRRQDLIDEFRNKRDEILGILSNIPFGILESDRAAGVSRRTYLPFQQIYRIQAGTQQLVGSSEFYRRDLGGEDDTIDFLIDRIRERSIRRDVDLNRDDFLFR